MSAAATHDTTQASAQSSGAVAHPYLPLTGLGPAPMNMAFAMRGTRVTTDARVVLDATARWVHDAPPADTHDREGWEARLTTRDAVVDAAAHDAAGGDLATWTHRAIERTRKDKRFAHIAAAAAATHGGIAIEEATHPPTWRLVSPTPPWWLVVGVTHPDDCAQGAWPRRKKHADPTRAHDAADLTATFIHALHIADPEAARRTQACLALHPAVARTIPAYFPAERAAYLHGAIAFAPAHGYGTVLALVEDEDTADAVATQLCRAFATHRIRMRAALAPIAPLRQRADAPSKADTRT